MEISQNATEICPCVADGKGEARIRLFSVICTHNHGNNDDKMMGCLIEAQVAQLEFTSSNREGLDKSSYLVKNSSARGWEKDAMTLPDIT